MNSYEATGRLVADPEYVKGEGEGSFSRATFCLAIKRKYRLADRQTADFIDCVAFGKTADWVHKWLEKGIRVEMCARVQTSPQTTKEGYKYKSTLFVIEDIDFAESKKDKQIIDSRKDATKTGELSDDGFMTLPDDLEAPLPFI